MPDATVDLMHHMQWWALCMAAEEAAWGDTGVYPKAPALDEAVAQAVSEWLWACADTILPRPNPDLVHTVAGEGA